MSALACAVCGGDAFDCACAWQRLVDGHQAEAARCEDRLDEPHLGERARVAYMRQLEAALSNAKRAQHELSVRRAAAQPRELFS